MIYSDDTLKKIEDKMHRLGGEKIRKIDKMQLIIQFADLILRLIALIMGAF